MAESLTDSELRSQLKAYGQTNIGPITSSTRSIYIKKLNHLRAAEKKSDRGGRKSQPSRKLTALSSDESEGEEDEAEEPSRPSRRGARRGKTKQADVEPPPARSKTRPAVTRPQPRASLRRRGVQSEADTSTASAGIQASLASNSSISISRDNTDGFNSTDHDESDADDNSVQSPERVTRSMNTSSYLDDSSFFNRTSKSDSFLKPEPDSSFRTSPSYEPQARRLPRRSSLGRGDKANTTQNSNRKSGGLKPSFPNSYLNNVSQKHSATSDSYLSEEENILSHGFKTKEDPSSYKWSQYISLLLLVLVGLFFILLGLSYMNVKMGMSGITDERDKWLICQYSGESGCYPKSEVLGARSLVVKIQEELANKAGDAICGGKADADTKMSIKDIKRALTKNIAASENLVEERLIIALDLIAHNPHWNIKLYDKWGIETTDKSSVSMLESTEPHLSLLCRLQKSVYEVMSTIMLCILVLAAILLLVSGIHYRWRRQRDQEKKVFDLVEQIIDILKSHHDSCQTKNDMEPYMAITHVRDMLIPIKERGKLQPLWNKAVKFLSANESRIRVETQKISGEEFEVWRWLQACPNGNKVWQGQAFGENRDVNLNSPPYSLTPCLKIRNMFDVDVECEENWHVRIQDAILEKCSPNHGIVHIAVDQTSREGCVYVKCTTSEASGRCYRALHGWWFDGNLVTVKYLRLERYHERFPDAKHANTPMVPSNNQRLSLSRPYHRSIIETS